MKKKTKPAAATHRAHVFYSGRVQGVGFRYTVEQMALDLGLGGWVKNLPDTRVELLCEGGKKEIENLLVSIKESTLGPHIKKVDCRWEEPTGKFTDFTVEFCL